MVPGGALAEVVEVGRDTLQVGQVLVALALEEREALLELGDCLLGLVVGAGLLLGGHYDCFASSSMTS